MTNEYSETLDRNGYVPSIMQNCTGCFLCSCEGRKLDRHEVYRGSYRKKSKALGLWVYLCHNCHMELHHKDARLDSAVKQLGQRVAMQHYGWDVDDFRQEFGKNYL